MKVYKCPKVYGGTNPSLFIAGGITGTDDWQNKFIKMFNGIDIDIVNPRRENFDSSNKKLEQQQIKWEYEALRRTDATSFWFPPETLCPITLFELGDQLNQVNRPLFVGVHPSYKRLSDIEIQTRLRRPDIEVVYSLEALQYQVIKWLSVRG